MSPGCQIRVVKVYRKLLLLYLYSLWGSTASLGGPGSTSDLRSAMGKTSQLCRKRPRQAESLGGPVCLVVPLLLFQISPIPCKLTLRIRLWKRLQEMQSPVPPSWWHSPAQHGAEYTQNLRKQINSTCPRDRKLRLIHKETVIRKAGRAHQIGCGHLWPTYKSQDFRQGIDFELFKRIYLLWVVEKQEKL